MKHTISVLFENKFNAIPRMVGLFSGRGYSIESISFGQGEEPGLTRATITTEGAEQIIEQIVKQLHKLVDVLKVVDLTYEPFVERELALVKVNSTPSTRAEIMQVTDIFRAKIIDISPKTLTIEVTGKSDKVNAAIGMLMQFGIREIARTGSVALKREFQGHI
ncbi:acetolactate synthase small subunit [bacterium]|nr:acetolactate synthase small subunit [candidate division CSSED10-310 bacterium]